MEVLLYWADVFQTISGLFFQLLGLFTVIWWFKPAKPPADDSNRINNISSWWIGLTKPHVLATSYKYYRQDVEDNMRDVGK